MKSEEFEAVTQDLKSRKIPAAVKCAVSAMLDKKAEKVVVLKLKGLNDITDYMVICHGNSARQNSAAAGEVQRKLRKGFKLKPFSVEGERQSEWILIDYIDFIVHIFLPESRAKYSLEKLWMDAKRYDFFID
ncbi:MAG: ribosome silencing factor [Candidatus Aminicenantes bacterium]|nr:ribosome silencing factor [Candidatus Aminicenantes bacterium]